MTDVNLVRQQIHDYIVTNVLFGTADLDNDTPLIDEGVLDSTGVLEMVLFAEEELGVLISDEEVLPERFASVNALAGFVTEKMQGQGSFVASETGIVA